MRVFPAGRRRVPGPQAVAKLAVEADVIDAVVDFDSHLDDPAQDWRNAAVCARVLALVK